MTRMVRDFEALSRRRFDLVVVGGGITGACLAWDASLRGLRVALVDKADFAGATTSASSKLIHGGLRYLKNGEVGLVRESLRERRILQTISPHSVRPIPFMIPTYRRGNLYWMIKGGMLAYDLLSFDRNRLEDPDQRIPGHRMLSVDEVLAEEPGVSRDGLTGGAIYYDCQCDPERHCLEFVLGAASLGAAAVNYARVVGLQVHRGRVERVELEDLVGGGRCEVETRMVANVAGPWADAIDHLVGAGEEVVLRRSKGIHLVTRPIARKHAVVLRTKAGRHFFIIPWRDHSLIGTTDTEYRGPIEGLEVTDGDVEGFIEEINEAYPSAALTPGDVQYRFAGVRPLVEQDTQVYTASRRYEIIDYHRRGLEGFVSAVGGKYTTSRNLARKLCDRIQIRLDRPVSACLTERRLLPGAVRGRFQSWLESSVAASEGLLPTDVLRYLYWTYGARASRVLDRVRADESLAERLVEGRPETRAEAKMVIEDEMAQTLCDVMFRRTGLGTLGHPGDEAVEQVCEMLSTQHGWDAERKEREKRRFASKIAGRREDVD
ncbi:MAG: glycerol-3-phosphate dehydrogenase/oxidase [Deltaproteobacteria bacterium]|nr:glycerol-3-phosphate dehydrogenase/oxidase [Deltaproteobacteria bacterium]